MDLWQYNAWCEAFKLKTTDSLSLQIQAAYLGAYWGGMQKQKKSLGSILKALRSDERKEVERKSIDIKKVADQFRQFEELQKYGRTQYHN